MGVLQRIALAYGLGALICMTVRRDYLWIVIAFLLLLYWGALAIFGGTDPYSLEGNLVLRIDRLILGSNHLYKGFGIPFEPEGLLSTIPSICTVIIGYYVGEIVGKGSPNGKAVLKIMIIGAALAGLGLLWNKFFPINKPLWTSSYVLYTGGLAMIVLSLIYWLADVLRFQKWGVPFMVFGTNALFAYFLAGIWINLILYFKVASGGKEISLYTWLYEKVCIPVAGNMNGSLMFAIIQMLFIFSITAILYRKKIMIRV
jgi:predicted acyltransferase